MSEVTVFVPDLGGADEVEVIEIFVEVGEHVDLDQSLIVVEGDKASMEIPNTHAGKICALSVQVGDTVKTGDPILQLESEASPASVSSDNDTSDTDTSDTEIETSTGNNASSNQTSDANVDRNIKSTLESSVIDVELPDLGGVETAEVIEVSAQPGEVLNEGDALIVIETDKASMDVPSPNAGKVESIAVSVGDSVAQGDVIAKIEVADVGVSNTVDSVPQAESSAAQVDSQPSALSDTRATPDPVSEHIVSEKDNDHQIEQPSRNQSVYAGPAVRKLARKLGVSLEKVKPSGPKNRLLKEDLENYVKTVIHKLETGQVSKGIPSIPDVDFAKFGEIEGLALSKIDKLTANNMHRAWLNVPHVTQFDEVDITALDEFRSELKPQMAERNTKVTPIAFLLKASAIALRAHTKINSSLSADGETLVRKHYVNIGIAVDTSRGLLVPVLRDVDQMGLWDIAAEVIHLSTKAREGTLSPAQMQGGCFTISSLGAIGGQGFTPIVNTPEVAILGVSKTQIRPVWDGANFVPRKMLPVSLSYDHRVINGADAGRFLTFLVEQLEDIRLLSL